MTKRFAEELKRAYHCASCSNPHAPARKFCEKHLAVARAAWQRHTKRCAAAGRCIDCPKPKLAKEQRCESCKEENRTYCRTWNRVHAVERKARRRALLAAGLCECCGRRPRVGVHARCETCYPKGYRS